MEFWNLEHLIDVVLAAIIAVVSRSTGEAKATRKHTKTLQEMQSEFSSKLMLQNYRIDKQHEECLRREAEREIEIRELKAEIIAIKIPK